MLRFKTLLWLESACCSLDPRGHCSCAQLSFGIVGWCLWCPGRVCWGAQPCWGRALHTGVIPRLPPKSFFYFCWDIWDLSVFHANFNLVRCFSWAVYRLAGSSKAQRDFFCRASLRTSLRETCQEPMSFIHYPQMHSSLKRVNPAELMQLLSLDWPHWCWGNCSRLQVKACIK